MKISAAQARLLNQFKEDPGLRISIWWNDKAKWKVGQWSFIGNDPPFKPRTDTIISAIKNAWLEPTEDTTFDSRHQIFGISDKGLHVMKQVLNQQFEVAISDRELTERILQALENRYARPEWVFVREAPIRTGFASQRMDGFALNCWRMNRFRRIGFEVKVSKSDWIKERSHPIKRRAAMARTNQFFFVCPQGMIKPDEVPEDCGLIYMNAKMELRQIIAAPNQADDPPDWPFVAALIRRALNIEDEQNVSMETPKQENSP